MFFFLLCCDSESKTKLSNKADKLQIEKSMLKYDETTRCLENKKKRVNFNLNLNFIVSDIVARHDGSGKLKDSYLRLWIMK